MQNINSAPACAIPRDTVTNTNFPRTGSRSKHPPSYTSDRIVCKLRVAPRNVFNKSLHQARDVYSETAAERDQNEMFRAATPPQTRKKAAAASLLVKSNVDSFLLRSSPRRRRIYMRGDWLPINLSGSGWRFQRVAPPARMRGSARPDNALFQGKLASGWPINRRDKREAASILLPGRMESVPVSALAGSCRACGDPLADDYSAALDAVLL